MPQTARQHFKDDIGRAEALHATGTVTTASPDLESDLYRMSVALAIGALDAYLCDAYIDCLSRTLVAYKTGKSASLPTKYAKELLPAGPLLAKYTRRTNWALRVAARRKMEKEKENFLQISRVKEILNPVLPAGKKLWVDLAEKYIDLDRPRLTSISKSAYTGTPSNAKAKARDKAANATVRRMGKIIQRRNDIVHNCDRPKIAVQALTNGAAKKMLTDIKSFVSILDDHLDTHRTC